MRALLLGVILLASACSRQAAQNYRHCLRLRVGMTREQALTAMGTPAETLPYVEGKSLPHLKGRTAYEWPNPASMSAPNRVSVDEASGMVTSIRCGDSTVTATVYIEPPEPAVSTTIIYGLQPDQPAQNAPSRRRTLREHKSSGSRSSGGPISQ